MKKSLVVVLALCFSTIYAQDKSSFGIKAGVNFAKLTGDDVEDADGRTGLNIGAIFELPISESFSIQPEVVYSQQGLQSEENGIESKLKLDYINIPVMAKFYVSDGFALELGPLFGFNINSEFEVDGGGSSASADFEAASFDLGLGGGISYQFDGGFFLQARYIIGVTNVDDSDEGGTFEDNLTNSVLGISAGFKF